VITVTILINGQPIFTRSAVNLDGKPISTYRVDDGNVIKHHRDDGAVQLAKAMLDCIKEPMSESK
jgi:hypothetical protein